MEGYETWENKKEDVIIKRQFLYLLLESSESTILLYRKCLPTNAVLSSSWRW